jgi:hypothetical protein
MFPEFSEIVAKEAFPNSYLYTIPAPFVMRELFPQF